MSDCLVCCGSKRIRLPLHHHALASWDGLPVLRDTSREYACPECCGIPEERVAFFWCHETISTEYLNEPDYMEAVKHRMARMLAEKFLEAGFIRVDVVTSEDQLHAAATATIGVVSERVVASMKQRIAKHQDMVAREVASAAAAGIRVWGSYYSGNDGNIAKSQAVDAVFEALKAVLGRFHAQNVHDTSKP